MANETVLFKRGDSATITSTPVTDGQILFDTSGNGKMYLDNGTDRLEMGGAITVDASLSKTSTNAIQNKAVTGNILNSLAEVSAATQQNTIAGALALKEVNNSLGGLSFTQDEKGNWGYIPSGADTVIPFKSGIKAQSFSVNVARNQSKTVKCNGGDILYVAISSYDYYYGGAQSFTATVSVSISGNIATIRNICDGGNTNSTITGNLLYAG